MVRFSRFLGAALLGAWAGLGVTAALMGTEANPSVRIQLRLVRAETLQNEPAVVEVTFTNVSQYSRVIEGALEAESKRLVYEIVDPRGRRFTYDPICHLDGASPQHELAPGESLVHREMLIYSVGIGAVFSEAGTYEIRATYQGALTSNAAILTVRPAKGSDIEAQHRFRGNPQAIFGAGMSTDWAIAEEFKWIAAQRPESPYAPWSVYFLGRRWQSKDTSRPEVRAEKAVHNYEVLLQEYPDFPLALEVCYQMAKEELRLHRTEEALRRLDELAERHPESDLLRNAKRKIQYYEKRGQVIPLAELP